MSKPIKLTDGLLAKIQKEFIESVKGMKMFDGKVSYTKNFKWKESEDDGAVITFTAAAFAKMTMLIQNFDSEVAWHGVVRRDPKCDSTFDITDILVYPQLVDGSNANTDQAEYTNWLYNLDDEVFNAVRMQGHSHVNFSTTPSAVDTTHQESILAQLEDDMFYIFMIWNKKFERNIKIFDLKNNTLYENNEITVILYEDGVDLNAFLKGAKEVVKPKPKPAVTHYYAGQQVGRAASPAVVAPQSSGSPTAIKQKPKEKPAIGTGWPEASGDFEDGGHPYGGYYDRYYR